MLKLMIITFMAFTSIAIASSTTAKTNEERYIEIGSKFRLGNLYMAATSLDDFVENVIKILSSRKLPEVPKKPTTSADAFVIVDNLNDHIFETRAIYEISMGFIGCLINAKQFKTSKENFQITTDLVRKHVANAMHEMNNQQIKLLISAMRLPVKMSPRKESTSKEDTPEYQTYLKFKIIYIQLSSQRAKYESKHFPLPPMDVELAKEMDSAICKSELQLYSSNYDICSITKVEKGSVVETLACLKENARKTTILNETCPVQMKDLEDRAKIILEKEIEDYEKSMISYNDQIKEIEKKIKTIKNENELSDLKSMKEKLQMDMSIIQGNALSTNGYNGAVWPLINQDEFKKMLDQQKVRILEDLFNENPRQIPLAVAFEKKKNHKNIIIAFSAIALIILAIIIAQQQGMH